jgi:hypothetical protein
MLWKRTVKFATYSGTKEHLKNPEYDSIDLSAGDEELGIENKTIQEFRIKNLKLRIFSEIFSREKHSMVPLNSAFRFISRSCPFFGEL